tara:strand:+ start:729 stop:905 length:177 start_codon:yes stop_codon:yes gene_type:complete
MSKKTPSPDSNFEKVWKEMDEIEPLTPLTFDLLNAYREAAKSDSYLFGEYDGYEAYKE